MSLATSLKNIVSGALLSVGDLAVTASYKNVTATGAYNPTTDSVLNTSVTKTLRVVKCATQSNEIPEDLRNFQVSKFIVAGKDLGSIPTLEDEITIGSEVFNVRRIEAVPGESVWVLLAVRV